ncbi:MAG: zinc dependent phospholipase C family protein [Clostridia bacterium]|nr:zinc dependent phospholipase C family protein [Clostridia bacterium]
MKAIDHITLGTYFARKYRLNKREKTVFLLGNIAPDLNPFTYITTSRGELLRGHSYTFKRKKIEKILESSRKHSLFWWYRVGRMCHYLTDSFTGAHDERRKMSIRHHKAYEHRLHHHFPRLLKIYIRQKQREKTEIPGSLSQYIAKLREKYETSENSVETDSMMILAAVGSVLDVLTEQIGE